MLWKLSKLLWGSKISTNIVIIIILDHNREYCNEGKLASYRILNLVKRELIMESELQICCSGNYMILGFEFELKIIEL